MCYCVTLELTPTITEHTLVAEAQLGPAIEPPLRTSPGTSLTRLPAEVLVQIAQSLNDHKSLVSFGRVNRRLNDLLTPLIYTKFDTAIGKETHFLRTLTSVPHLADHVKHLRWMDQRDNWDDDKEAYETENRHTIASQLSALPSLFHKQLAIAVEHAVGGTLHVSFLAAAMSLTPNLETLDATLTTSNSSRIRWNEAVWIGSSHVFAHLHTVKIKLRRSAGMDLNPLFLLPAVRTLDMTHVDRLKTDPQKTIWLPLPEGSSNVETLMLRESNIDTDILVPAIKACKRLRTFLFQHHSKWSPLRKVDLAQLSSALLVHRETLRDLGIMDRLNESDETNNVVVDDLMEMPHLENVLLPLSNPNIKDTPSLKIPPKVQWFAQTIKGDEARKTFEGFLSLCARSAKQVKQENPVLQSITVWLAEKEHTNTLVSYMAKQACKKEGVELNVKVLDKKSDVSTAVEDWERGVTEK